MIPGDPAAIEAGADSLLAAANAFSAASDSASSDARSATAGWEGEAADAARAALNNLAQRTEVGVEICRLAAVVLQNYAAELRAAQVEWLTAQSAYNSAQRQAQQEADAKSRPPYAQPLGGPTPLFQVWTPYTGIMDQARAAMQSAETRALDANTRAASAIQELTGALQEMAPTPPPAPTSPAVEQPHHGIISSIIHTGLDVAGLVPVLGEPADGLNAVYYGIEGDKLNAGLSAAGMIPFLGWGATGAKLTRKGVDAVEAARDVDHAVDAADAARHIVPTPATFGKAPLNSRGNIKHYTDTFFEAHPELKGKGYWVHHAVEQQSLKLYPNAVTPSEIHSLENLRGIPPEINADVHLSKIRMLWDDFYIDHPNATRQELLDFATKVDDLHGAQFDPPVR